MMFLPRSAIALALLITPAASGATADPMAALGPAASDAALDGKAKLGPNTIPGFFDVTTGRFTPLSAAPLAAGKTVSGTFTVHPIITFDLDITGTDTIFCQVTIIFGNVVNKQFFSNHTASASVNFSENHSDGGISVPYSYTPNSNNAKIQLDISCRANGDSGAGHSAAVFGAVENVPDGNVTRTMDLRL
jgi:hypothetical protein